MNSRLKRLTELYETVLTKSINNPPPPGFSPNKYEGDSWDSIRYIIITALSRALPQVIEMYRSVDPNISEEECYEALLDTHESMIENELDEMYEEGNITEWQKNKAIEALSDVDQRLNIDFSELEW